MAYELTELAWAAGFFDGEGCVGAYPIGGTASTRPRPSAQVSQIETAPLERFVRAVGIGRVNGPYQQKTGNHRPYWSVSIEGRRQVAELAAILWEFLGETKRQAFTDAIAAYDSWWENPRCKRGHIMQKGKQGRPYCHKCRSKAAYDRWEKQKEAV